MVATRDVGAVIAAALQAPPSAHEAIDVEGPAYTERAVAEQLAAAIGRTLEVVTVPQQGWVGAGRLRLADAGRGAAR